MPATDINTIQTLDDDISFPIEEIIQHPLPGLLAPTSITFSPDDTHVSYLFSPSQNLNKNVFAFYLKSREAELFFSPPDGGGVDESNISAEEKLRRERLRERGLGVTRYEWVKGSLEKKTIMVPLSAGIYFQDLSCEKPDLKLTWTPSSPVIDPRLSPDGSMLAFVRDYELHVMSLCNNEITQLTFGANGGDLTHGLAEYIAQEEMDRKIGYWWSLDNEFIAFAQVDSSEIPLYRIMHQGKSSVGSDAQEDHAYPFAGASNVKVRLGVVSTLGNDITWMDLYCGHKDPYIDEEYLARVNWMEENILIAQVLNRSHTKLKIVKFDIKTGERKVLFVEEQETWINLHDCFTPLYKGDGKFSNGFIWASEKTGYRHLYLHDKDGACVGPITGGEWIIEQISGVDEDNGVIYFTGTFDGPLETHLYRTKLYPDFTLPLQNPQRITRDKGKHMVVLDHELRNFVDTHNSLELPPRVMLCSLNDGSLLMTLYEQPFPTSIVKRLQLEPPKIVQIEANDGTTLYGTLYKPDESRFGPPPYKTLVSVYGGPCVQIVSDTWMNTVDLRAQYLRSKGFLIWKLDNRGSSRRGLKFEGAVKHNFGRLDAEDQLTGAKWLINQGLAKAGSIGISGWSYGGYLSAITLARFPDTFQCAVSGAPVTSWDGYDTFYTEKYMGTPTENPDGYEFGSVMHHVDNMKGKLLLVHGMIDENVHFRHTARLVNALVAVQKPYELLIFPDERHMPRGHKDRVYIEERVFEFVKRNL